MDKGEPESLFELTPEEGLLILQRKMEQTVNDAVAVMRERNPQISPIAASSEVVGWVAAHMMTFAPAGAVRLGVLMAYEGAHPAPMNFIDISKAKDDLVRIASTRKTVERGVAAAKAGILTPNQEDQGNDGD